MTNVPLTSNQKLYAVGKRECWKLGDHYTRNSLAMTAEGLHKKSDIAAELGVRDAEIERLTQLLNARPPYYCQKCECTSCGNTRRRPDETSDVPCRICHTSQRMCEGLAKAGSIPRCCDHCDHSAVEPRGETFESLVEKRLKEAKDIYGPSAKNVTYLSRVSAQRVRDFIQRLADLLEAQRAQTRAGIRNDAPDERDSSPEEPSPERRCVCGLAAIPEGELRVEAGPTTHRLAGPCFQTSSVKAPCERCEGSGRLTIYDTAMYPGQACSPIGDEPCPACQPENGTGDGR